MQLYELLYIIKNDYSDEQIPEIVKKITEFVKKTAGNAQIKSHNLLERRKLAYPINHTLSGYYGLVEFKATPSHIINLEKVLRLSDDLLRHLIVKKEEISEKERAKTELLKAKIQEVKSRKREKEAITQDQTKQQLVQKPEEIVDTKKTSKKGLEELEEKLDEILKRDIVE